MPTAMLAVGLTALSGVAGLGYEIIWSEQLGLALGHEYVALLAVLAAFFSGLALGAQLLARVIERSQHPARWFAACEGVIALWALGLRAAMPAVSQALARAIGPQPSAAWHWSVAFLGPLFLLAPATMAMGAGMPALERALARDTPVIGAIYGANTLGAVIGVLACAFWLVPQLGLANAAAVCACVNAGCALLALSFWEQRVTTPLAPAAVSGERRVWLALVASGVLGIGYEVLALRVLSQINQGTVYTFSILLAVYLLGSALGSALHQRWLAQRAHTSEAAAITAAISCLVGAASLWLAPTLRPAIAAILSAAHLPPLAAGLASEAVLGVLAFLPPTAAMAVLFNQLCLQARAAGLGFARALAANTLGAAFAPLLFGVVMIPLCGPKLGLLAIALAYLALVPASAWRDGPRLRVVGGLAATAILAMLLALPPLALVDIPPGGRLISYEDGIAAAVSVSEDADGVRALRIDNRQREGSSATLFADARQAWLPLLLHAAPHKALFLGLGSGITAGAAAWDPSLQVEAVELLPEVVRASRFFSAALDSPRTPELRISDARRYVRASAAHYDVIIADLFHPARSGSGALYSVEHFAAVRERLAVNGLFCQWLPLHQLDPTTLRSIVAAFVHVFPSALAVLATHSLDTPVLGLIARPDLTRFSFHDVRARVQASTAAARLSQLHLDDEWSVLGSIIAGPNALRALAAGAPLNTDDRPIVAWRAPFITYAPSSAPHARLLQLLHSLHTAPSEVISDEPDSQPRLARYWAARLDYLELGTHVQPSADPRAMLAQLQEPLLTIVRASPEFRAAYDPLLAMAGALPDRTAARALLQQLTAAAPTRAEASRALQTLTP